MSQHQAVLNHIAPVSGKIQEDAEQANRRRKKPDTSRRFSSTQCEALSTEFYYRYAINTDSQLDKTFAGLGQILYILHFIFQKKYSNTGRRAPEYTIKQLHNEA